MNKKKDKKMNKKLETETKKKEVGKKKVEKRGVRNKGAGSREVSRGGLVSEGRVYIKATFNNTIVTITDDTTRL